MERAIGNCCSGIEERFEDSKLRNLRKRNKRTNTERTFIFESVSGRVGFIGR